MSKQGWLLSICAIALSAGFAEAKEGTWPRFQAGVHAYRRGDFKLAEAHFATVIKADPKFGDAYYYLGVLAERKSKTRTAITYFKAVNEKWPTYALSQERLGQIALKLKDLKSAAHYFQVVAKVAPTVHAWLQLAGVQLDMQKYKEAEASLKAGAKMSKNDLNLVEMKARLYSETDRHKQAYDCYGIILKAMPRDATTRYMSALCLVEMKRPDDAVDEMEKVLKLDPFHKGALLHLLAAYEDDASKSSKVELLQARLERLRKHPPKVRRVSGSKK